ncbi:MAG TPA: alanine dehydrogenase [Cytophagales bacterium]|nr:alanine dehydrogenase [Cytophagales bacterium]
MFTIGILRETRIPADSRVAITPMLCLELSRTYHIRFLVQPSPFRIFKDEEYRSLGIEICEDLSSCDVLFGVKEVNPETLIAHKKYFFFSHTAKKQPHNRKLLQTIIEKKITLIDYEEIRDIYQKRLVAFGHFAGLVGAYNALLHYGKKQELYALKPAHQCYDLKEMVKELQKLKLPPIKIVLTGSGRVGSSAREILQHAEIEEVNTTDFISKKFDKPVFCQLKSKDFMRRKDGAPWNSAHFHQFPEQYESFFLSYAKVADLLVAGAFWNPAAPALFSKKDMLSSDFNIRMVADITCDIHGSIPCTVKTSSIPDPVYDYNPQTDEVEPPYSKSGNITVMAVDNLPCELPRDASESFARQLSQHVFYNLIVEDKDFILNQATIVKEGKLTIKYAYLSDYVLGT